MCWQRVCIACFIVIVIASLNAIAIAIAIVIVILILILIVIGIAPWQTFPLIPATADFVAAKQSENQSRYGSGSGSGSYSRAGTSDRYDFASSSRPREPVYERQQQQQELQHVGGSRTFQYGDQVQRRSSVFHMAALFIKFTFCHHFCICRVCHAPSQWVKLRGLPFQSRESEIWDFFSKAQVQGPTVTRHCLHVPPQLCRAS